MAQRLIKVRVRSPRVTLLIQKDASDAELLLAFEFFSKKWGGLFANMESSRSTTKSEPAITR
jgi:hypothetical protein